MNIDDGGDSLEWRDGANMFIYIINILIEGKGGVGGSQVYRVPSFLFLFWKREAFFMAIRRI